MAANVLAFAPKKSKKTNVSRMRNEIVPFAAGEIRFGGMALVENPDPVLRYLAMKGEEHYRMMERSELSIFSAKQHRSNTLLAAGSEVIAGPADTPRAHMLREWSIAFLKRIPHFNTVLRKCLDALYWGWRPLEVLWEFDMQFDGQSYWGVRRISEKNPEEFRFTEDRTLVYVGTGYQEEVVFDRPEDQLHWLICTSGSTDNPYGDALYKNIWLTWYIKNRYTEMWSQGMERSLGVLSAKEAFGVDAATGISGGGKNISELANELKGVLDVLSKNNILVQRAGWSLEFLTDISFSEAWKHPLEYCDKLIQLGITGESLTMDAGDSGSRALGDVARQGLLDYVKSDAKELEGWINDGLLAEAIMINFGMVDDGDMPRWRSKMSNPISLKDARTLWEMGAVLDGKKLAGEFSIPILIEPDEDDVPLQIQSQSPGGSPMDATDPEDPDGGEDDDPVPDTESEDRPRRRGLPAAVYDEAREEAEAFDEEIDDKLGNLSDVAKSSTEKYVQGLLGAWLGEFPDPTTRRI